MRRVPVQTVNTVIQFIDVQVRAVLLNVYKGRVKVGVHTAFAFYDKRTAERFREDYLELTQLYMVKYEDKLRALGFTDQI